MPKFQNFSETNYAKIWGLDSSEARNIVTTILANPDLILQNHTFWRSQFIVDPTVTPTNDQGEAQFRSRMRQMETGVLMDMRAPLGDSLQREIGGEAFYTGSIPGLQTKGFVETAKERLAKEKLFEQFGDTETANLAMYAQKAIQLGLDDVNQTLSHMSAYLLSRGSVSYKQGQGIQEDIYQAYMPDDNFDTAGEKVWSDSTAKLITQMIEKQQKFLDKWGVDISLKWQIEKSQFDSVFINNAQVKSWFVDFYNMKNGTNLALSFTPTRDMVLEALAAYPELAPIELIEEKQKDVLNGVVKGWKTGVAVLRPTGYAGYIRRTYDNDEELLSKYAGNRIENASFVRTLDGLVTIGNFVVTNGILKEFHTDMWMAAIPSLDEFLYHVIIDTTTADS